MYQRNNILGHTVIAGDFQPFNGATAFKPNSSQPSTNSVPTISMIWDLREILILVSPLLLTLLPRHNEKWPKEQFLKYVGNPVLWKLRNGGRVRAGILFGPGKRGQIMHQISLVIPINAV